MCIIRQITPFLCPNLRLLLKLFRAQSNITGYTLQSPNLSMTSEVERRAKSPLLEFEFAGHAMITGTNCVTKGRALETWHFLVRDK